jgi:DNA-binding transcriptional regulator YhcF (GntR family)
MTMPKAKCGECRDLFDEACAAGQALRSSRQFAHAHHVITSTARRALVTYLSAAGTYRVHKDKCPLRKIA